MASGGRRGAVLGRCGRPAPPAGAQLGVLRQPRAAHRAAHRKAPMRARLPPVAIFGEGDDRPRRPLGKGPLRARQRAPPVVPPVGDALGGVPAGETSVWVRSHSHRRSGLSGQAARHGEPSSPGRPRGSSGPTSRLLPPTSRAQADLLRPLCAPAHEHRGGPRAVVLADDARAARQREARVCEVVHLEASVPGWGGEGRATNTVWAASRPTQDCTGRFRAT